jgi:hypothetical protein
MKTRFDDIQTINLIILPLTEARQLSPGHFTRLFCRAYWPVSKTLPNGLPCLSSLMADALLDIGGDFRIVVRVLRSAPGLPPSLLLIERLAWDIRANRWVLMPPYAPAMIRAIYDMMASRQALMNARQSAEGRRN